jgi:metal-dependent hydrolase (beta-lactamase superfamily II)
MAGTYATSAKGYVILTGTSHPDLANKIVGRLATALGKASVYQKVWQEKLFLV